MELREYQAKALETAQPEAFSLDYLVPGIVGEVGELFGQKAKAHWHGWPVQQLQRELASEYGDICWMTAILLHTCEVAKVVDDPLPPLRPEYELLVLASDLYARYTYSQELERSATYLWRVLEVSAPVVTGYSLDAVLSINLRKLADRAQRGVLRGAGDHR